MKYLVFIAVLFLQAEISPQAHRLYNAVTGNLVYTNGSPAPDREVWLLSEYYFNSGLSAFNLTAITDSSGYFEFNNIMIEGTYYLAVLIPGTNDITHKFIFYRNTRSSAEAVPLKVENGIVISNNIMVITKMKDALNLSETKIKQTAASKPWVSYRTGVPVHQYYPPSTNDYPGYDSLKYLTRRWVFSGTYYDDVPLYGSESDSVLPAGAYTFEPDGTLLYETPSEDTMLIELKWRVSRIEPGRIIILTPQGDLLYTWEIKKINSDTLAAASHYLAEFHLTNDTLRITSYSLENEYYSLAADIKYKLGSSGSIDYPIGYHTLSRWRASAGSLFLFIETEGLDYITYFFNMNHRTSAFDKYSSEPMWNMAFEFGLNFVVQDDKAASDYPFVYFFPYIKWGPEARLTKNFFVTGGIGITTAVVSSVNIPFPYVSLSSNYLIEIGKFQYIDIETGVHTSLFPLFLFYISAGFALN